MDKAKNGGNDEYVLNEDNIVYRDLFKELIEGFALHEIILDEIGNPINYRFLDINPAFEKMVGLKAKDVLGKLVLDVLPHTEKFWIETYGRVATTGESIIFEHYATEQKRFYQVTSFSPKKGQFVTLFEDVTLRKEAEDKLKEILDETKKMNEIMIGREMKMIELKERNRELEDKIKNLESQLSNNK